MSIDSTLTTKLEVASDEMWGPCIYLINWEHADYIEDVLAEHFDLEYQFKISDEDENKYVLYFADKASFKDVEKAARTINEFHLSKGKLYETI